MKTALIKETESSKSHVKSKLDFLKKIFIENYEAHERTFDGKNRDFTDSLLISRKEAEEEDKESKKYLDKWNIINTTFNCRIYNTNDT